MTMRERIELMLHCMNSVPRSSLQFAENYKWYSRLLNVWNKRYNLNNK